MNLDLIVEVGVLEDRSHVAATQVFKFSWDLKTVTVVQTWEDLQVQSVPWLRRLKHHHNEKKGFEAFPGLFPLSFLTWILTWQRWTSKGKRENSMLQVIVGFANNDISTNTAPSSFNEQFTAIWWMMWGPCRPCWGELGCWGRPSTPPFSSCGGRRWVSRSCPIAWSSRPQNTDCKTMSIDY